MLVNFDQPLRVRTVVFKNYCIENGKYWYVDSTDNHTDNRFKYHGWMYGPFKTRKEAREIKRQLDKVFKSVEQATNFKRSSNY